MSRLILILGDQLSPDIAALAEADRDRDIVVMAEVVDEAGYVRHHPKKIAFLFSAMRKFALSLEADGWTVAYTRLDDPDNTGSIPGELRRRAEQHGTSELWYTEPGEWRLIEVLEDYSDTISTPCRRFADTRFLSAHKDFEDWAEGRKALRMEYFYRDMRRKTGLLMDGDDPVGGKWNFDHDNRKPPPDSIDFGGPMRFSPDETVEEVLTLVRDAFPDNFGVAAPDFWFATDTGQARRALTHFVKNALPNFGDYQDAMLSGERFLYHSVLSIYLNAGLLDPMEVCEAAEEAYAERRCADQRGRGLHPPDHRLARIHARHLLPAKAPTTRAATR